MEVSDADAAEPLLTQETLAEAGLAAQDLAQDDF
jgi:hypothetical protein